MIDIHIFCYGSLKQGHWNHHFCKNATNIEPAVVCGKLYQLPPGYPALQVPNDSILLAGIKDAFESAQEQYQENKTMDFEFQLHKDWDTVHGELVTFSDPERNIPPIDQLEGTPFYYDRVLVPVQKADGTIIAAWAYVMYDIPNSVSYLPNGIWPENNKMGGNNVRR
jgi:gamma-glutamylcyclotransferase (GGCT)/AIG2-like uncharacterized protein YtfP